MCCAYRIVGFACLLSQFQHSMMSRCIESVNMHSERGNTCDKHSLWEFCGFDVHNYTHTRSCPSFLSSGGARVFMPASTCLLQSKRLSMFFLTLGRFKLDKSPIVGTTASTTCQGQFDVDFQISVENNFRRAPVCP